MVKKERILFMENGWFSSYLFSFAQGPLGTGDMYYYTATAIKEQEKKRVFYKIFIDQHEAIPIHML